MFCLINCFSSATGSYFQPFSVLLQQNVCLSASEIKVKFKGSAWIRDKMKENIFIHFLWQLYFLSIQNLTFYVFLPSIYLYFIKRLLVVYGSAQTLRTCNASWLAAVIWLFKWTECHSFIQDSWYLNLSQRSWNMVSVFQMWEFATSVRFYFIVK